MSIISYTIEELIEEPELSPLPLEVIPNHMGINLCSVESLSWTKQHDGQLQTLMIHFTPANN